VMFSIAATPSAPPAHPLTRLESALVALCSNCELRPPIADGRCEPCYRWRRRHKGQERPDRFFESHLDRAYRAFEVQVVREDLARYQRLTE
jgi:hypothetical protein